jgi:hypothetical protein
VDDLDVLAMLLANAVERDGLGAVVVRTEGRKMVLVGNPASAMPPISDVVPSDLAPFDGMLVVRYDERGMPVWQASGDPGVIPSLQATASGVMAAMHEVMHRPEVVQADLAETPQQAFTRRASAIELARREQAPDEDLTPWMRRCFGEAL